MIQENEELGKIQRELDELRRKREELSANAHEKEESINSLKEKSKQIEEEFDNSELKNVIEDKKILLTPKNFMKNKKDPFLSYKINEFIQSLNANFTYQYRYILAKNFDIEFDKYLFSPTKYDNFQRKK